MSEVCIITGVGPGNEKRLSEDFKCRGCGGREGSPR